MATPQRFLFDGKSEPDGLILAPQPQRPLTKAQRTFNRLVAQVEALRSRIVQETGRLDAALTYYAEHIHPRLRRQTELKKDLVRLLAPFLAKKHLRNKNDRNALRAVIAQQLLEIIREDGSLQGDDLRAIFKQVHEMDFERARQQEIDQVRSEMEMMIDELGLDVDFSDFDSAMSDSEVSAKMAAKMAEFSAAMKDQAAEARSFEKPRRKTKRQLEKEERLRQEEEIRQKSIATIYRELAKILHPDLEQDPSRRESKVVLMQDLTIAYRNNDLHTLLRLELEWIQREEGNLERLTDNKLAVYNQVLRDQVRNLEHELALLPEAPRYRVLSVPDGPFGFRVRTDGPAEARSLDDTIESLDETIGQLRSANPLATVREIVKTYRNAPQMPAWDDVADLFDDDILF
ncbi:MAG TPA: hypothetical protein VGK48_07665 [Terriglobia bacterium]